MWNRLKGLRRQTDRQDNHEEAGQAWADACATVTIAKDRKDRRAQHAAVDGAYDALHTLLRAEVRAAGGAR